MENIIKQKLIERGFNEKTLLNNRGLIGACIEETEQQLNLYGVGYSKKTNAISDKEYIKIFDLYREEFTCVADDKKLKEWGNSDEEIKYIKIRGGRSILLTYKEGIKIAKTLQEMNLL